MNIGEKLQKLRGDIPISKVAKAVNVSEQAIWNYENNKRIPRDEVKIRIAKYYNSSVEKIFFEEIVNK